MRQVPDSSAAASDFGHDTWPDYSAGLEDGHGTVGPGAQEYADPIDAQPPSSPELSSQGPPSGPDAAPGGSAVSPATQFDEIARRMSHEIEALRSDFQHKILYDRTKDDQIRDLNKELQSHRAGLLINAMRPVIDELIGLHRTVDKKVNRLAMNGPQDDVTEAVIRALIDIREELEIALDRQGIEAYEHESDVADPRLQFVIRPVETGDPDLTGVIVRRLARGYRIGERILDKERVEAYRYVAGVAPDVTTAASAPPATVGVNVDQTYREERTDR